MSFPYTILMIEVTVEQVQKDSLEKEYGAFIVFLTKNEGPLGAPEQLISAFEAQINALKETNDLPEDKKKTSILYSPGLKTKRLGLVGFGEKDEVDLQLIREVSAIIGRKLRDLKSEKIVYIFPEGTSLDSQDIAKAIVEGAILGTYKFTELKTKDKDKFKPITYIGVYSKEDISKGLRWGKVIAESTNLARDLANRPSNIATPTHFVEVAKEYLKKYDNMKIDVLDEKQCKKLGMGAFLAVAKGSDEPAKFLIMEYKGGNPEDKPVVLVGKGVTFDTGGISLKPQSAIVGMKGDCSGAAAVIGAVRVAAELGLPLNVVGLAPLTENMPSGKATKPEDVVYAMNGKSIEIINTDAEGRLILADALCYAERYEPKWVVDLATLTGAIVIALGDQAAGLFSKDDTLRKRLKLAGERSGERLWSMPLFDGYYDQLKSKVADMKNVGGRPAGSATAAAFLSNFAENYPWAHLDIAGIAWVDKSTPLCEEGMTGAGVRVLSELLFDEAKIRNITIE